jgi:hypothetical protein
MELKNYDKETHVSTYEHNGVTFKCAAEAIADALYYYKVDLFSLIEKDIDSFIRMADAAGLSKDFSVCVKITRDIAIDNIERNISVSKIAKHND